jgi:MOSC domain-containing protein YiiM
MIPGPAKETFMTARLLSIQVGLPQRHETPGKGLLETAIFKQAVEGLVHVGREHLAGDGQANLRAHGGPERAVLAYAAEHYPSWRAEYPDQAFEYGSFGENFTVEGLNEDTVCIGDAYRIGSAVIQVTMPRTPCPKIDRRTGIDGILGRVEETHRMGWLHRVLEEGAASAGDAVMLVERPCPEWSVSRVYAAMRGLRAKDAAHVEDARRMLELEPLGSQYKTSFAHLLGSLQGQ